MAKDIRFNVEARELMKQGVDQLANAVTVSYTHLTLPTNREV